MKCWCKKIVNEQGLKITSYECLNCEKKAIWKRVAIQDKLDLLAYEKQIRLNRVDNKLLLKLLNKNLCISMIPERKTL